jgi:hypothetical protein
MVVKVNNYSTCQMIPIQHSSTTAGAGTSREYITTVRVTSQNTEELMGEQCGGVHQYSLD